ncbi:hypothetical protein A2368_00720 [Candidatus Collierbacteria bacterium RIFOXYB1_FULL_49_13]|uniref:Uncharacterized protein n=1 Tax=Candidatus Collierbacteria bacterium RIFOXYB1_FULL_49_13 TaxID=1817728 RepID=A0A1F5FHH8_9BACT|nr:MAG: hypothetical protein A2368_00720 [Candidatus Collierbacteria bacterium RIFOXYB1_FULL_49_13]
MNDQQLRALAQIGYGHIKNTNRLTAVTLTGEMIHEPVEATQRHYTSDTNGAAFTWTEILLTTRHFYADQLPHVPGEEDTYVKVTTTLTIFHQIDHVIGDHIVSAQVRATVDDFGHRADGVLRDHNNAIMHGDPCVDPLHRFARLLLQS